MPHLTTSKKLETADLAPQAHTRGFFITMEGSEGCGKSTQIARLSHWLKQENPSQEIVTLREPGGTALGEETRRLLQHAGPSVEISPEAELLLFAASRAQLVREVIRPALDRGAIVLCDRFFDSTTVYQGVARALNSEDVAFINHFAAGGLMPNLTILLDLEASEGRARMGKRNQGTEVIDRMEQEPEAFYEAVRAGYLKLAAAAPERWMLLDASQEAERVTQQIIMILKSKLEDAALFPVTCNL